MYVTCLFLHSFVFLLVLTVGSASAQLVKVTPLESHDGEFCRNDRAILFEDPNGTTLLYDAGRPVRGPGDSRLPANLNVVLLSSVHSDHLGDSRPSAANLGVCGNPTRNVDTTPNSNTAEIAAGKNVDRVIVGGEMHTFLTPRILAANKAFSGQIQIVRHGGKRIFNSVRVAIVTGHTSDMATIVRGFYGAQVAVMNIGDIFSMGPEEAAFAVNELVKPKSVIASHANEAATVGGVIQAGTKTAQFASLVSSSINVHPSLSGVTMQFDGTGVCVSGC